eukprot:TRINITY_DN4372_c0_g1_i1.p1 TRINITY_DN4372_c0_g1~~TRINITY_DN4372_c0_g1_i1.p1  ORF type:complete len:291 (-),score=30.94 TRINITY_DN4372_c0_g1_i1:81-899(-)
MTPHTLEHSMSDATVPGVERNGDALMVLAHRSSNRFHQSLQDIPADESRSIQESYDFSFLALLTGIYLDSSSSEILPSSLHHYQIEGSVRRFVMKGRSFGYQFSVQFDSSDKESRVLLLRISVDTSLSHTLRPWTSRYGLSSPPMLSNSRLEQLCNVHQFFEVFSHYCRLLNHRTQLYKELLLQYPDFVKLPLGHRGPTLAFDSETCSLLLNWTLGVNLDGGIQGHPLLTGRSLATDESADVYASLEENFQALLNIKGFRTALQIMFTIAAS